MTYINISRFVLINFFEKVHSMIEMHRLKNVVIFIQTVLSFVLSGKISNRYSVDFKETPAGKILLGTCMELGPSFHWRNKFF